MSELLPKKRLHKLFPFLEWLPLLKDPDILRADMIAGLTVALVLIPQSMAYANLAGLPAHYGLYAAFLPVMVGALWGSSKQLGTGPVAIVSLMTATAISTVIGGTALEDPSLAAQYILLAMFMAFMVGVVQFSLGFFRLGIIVNFLSHPVILAFTNAAALVIGLSQMSKIFGVNMPGAPSDHFLTVRIWGVFQQLGDTHLPTLMMGVGAFAIMWGMRRYKPKLPGVLVAVVASILLSWSLRFQESGGKVVGEIPKGLPDVAMPGFDWELFGALLPAVIIISLVGFMEAISIAKAIAARTKDRIDPNQELIGQGLANIAGSFSQAYPTSGSFSRSAVNYNAGARTGFSSVVTAACVVATLLFFTPLLYHLPQAVLAAVIMMAVFGLVDFKAIKHAFETKRNDGIAAIVTFVCTLAFAPHLDQGIMIGAGLALGMYLFQTMRPRVAILGRDEDGTFHDLANHENLIEDKDIILLRFDGSLYFANVAFFEDAVLNAVAENPEAKFVLIFGDSINQMDATGKEVLHQLLDRLRANNMQMVFSGFKKQILDVLRKAHLYDVIGQENLFRNEEMAIKDIYRRSDREGADRPLLYYGSQEVRTGEEEPL